MMQFQYIIIYCYYYILYIIIYCILYIITVLIIIVIIIIENLTQPLMVLAGFCINIKLQPVALGIKRIAENSGCTKETSFLKGSKKIRFY